MTLYMYLPGPPVLLHVHTYMMMMMMIFFVLLKNFLISEFS